MEKKNSHYFYILECRDGSFYGGYTIDPARRLEEHNTGKGAKYTRARRPVKMIYQVAFEQKRTALQAEYAFKQLTRKQKEKFLMEKSANRIANTKEFLREQS